MKKNNKKGFTLAELLIVIAIIAVLVAIAIPVFTGAMAKAEEAVDQANTRAIKAMATVKYLENNTYTGETFYVTADGDISTSDADAKYAYDVSVDSSGNVTITDGTIS